MQGHSGSTITPALQDNVLLSEAFAEYIYHVGNGKAFRSMVNHGLIPGVVSLRTGRQAVFFTIVNPMGNQDGFGETCATCHKQEIAPSNLETLSEYSMLVQFEARSSKRTAILSNNLYDTLLAEFIEKAICMKTKDQPYQRESVILRSRVVLQGNSQ